MKEEAGGGGRKERCSTKNKNPTRQCGEKPTSSNSIHLFGSVTSALELLFESI